MDGYVDPALQLLPENHWASESLNGNVDKENNSLGVWQNDDSDDDMPPSTKVVRKKIVLTASQKTLKKVEEEAALVAVANLRQNVREAIDQLATDHHQ